MFVVRNQCWLSVSNRKWTAICCGKGRSFNQTDLHLCPKVKSHNSSCHKVCWCNWVFVSNLFSSQVVTCWHFIKQHFITSHPDAPDTLFSSMADVLSLPSGDFSNVMLSLLVTYCKSVWLLAEFVIKSFIKSFISYKANFKVVKAALNQIHKRVQMLTPGCWFLI